MRKICKNCQYLRKIASGMTWCGNSKSLYYRGMVYASESCLLFTQRGKKAPWWMRMQVKVMNRLLSRLLKD